MDRIAALRDLGVAISHETVWVGEVGTAERRQEPDTDTISGVRLPLDAEEWCRCCMRTGDMYVGGCCGTTSAMQDILNGVFRDGGFISDEELLALANLAQSHEGFDEDFDPEMNDERFSELVSHWAELDPWVKISLCYQATATLLKPSWQEVPTVGRRDLDETKAIRTLADTLGYLRWADLFGDEEERRNGQHEANNLLLLSRALVPAQQFLAQISDRLGERFDGYAIFETGSEHVVSNRHGLCLYSDHAAAETMVAQWRRYDADEDEEDRVSDRIEIRPVTVTVAGGIEARDEN